MKCPCCGNELVVDGWGGKPNCFGSTDVWYYCSKCDKMFKNL